MLLDYRHGSSVEHRPGYDGPGLFIVAHDRWGEVIIHAQNETGIPRQASVLDANGTPRRPITCTSITEIPNAKSGVNAIVEYSKGTGELNLFGKEIRTKHKAYVKETGLQFYTAFRDFGLPMPKIKTPNRLTTRWNRIISGSSPYF